MNSQLKENVDYEFIAVGGEENSWRVRFLTGPYPETIISFGKVTAFENEHSDDATLKFDFDIHLAQTKCLPIKMQVFKMLQVTY